MDMSSLRRPLFINFPSYPNSLETWDCNNNTQDFLKNCWTHRLFRKYTTRTHVFRRASPFTRWGTIPIVRTRFVQKILFLHYVPTRPFYGTATSPSHYKL